MSHSAQYLTVAAFQGKAVYGNTSQTIRAIQAALFWAEQNNVDILCFPECYLQGYILDEFEARRVSLDLNSSEFKSILEKLKTDKVTLILGIIERDGEKIYNTAVVIEEEKLIGKYRKHFIHNKENIFICGVDFPVFEKNNIKYGINICYDSRFPESAEALVKKGAQIIFCPLNNSLPHDKADEWKDKYIQYLINKAKMSGCWIVSADVVEKSESNTGYGCTSLISPEGKIIEYLAHSVENKFVRNIVVTS
jgi:predicted amidohydrolase